MDGGQAMDRRTFMVLVSGGLFAAPLTAEAQRVLRLVSEPVAFHTRDVDYLQVDGKTFHATVYQPEGSGPFPAILDVHGGAWIREDVRRDEHALVDQALAAMGMVVVAIDFRQSPQHRYPDSVADVLLNSLRPSDPRYAALPVCGHPANGAGVDYVILAIRSPILLPGGRSISKPATQRSWGPSTSTSRQPESSRRAFKACSPRGPRM